MNKTKRLTYNSLGVTIFLFLYFLMPYCGTQLWTAYLVIMFSFNGIKATILFLAMESLLLTVLVVNVPLMSLFSFYFPVMTFIMTFFWVMFTCSMSFVAFYLVGELIGIRKKLEKVFP